MSEKHQIPARRVANAAWLREQIQELVVDCDESIEEDQTAANQSRDDAQRNVYLARVENDRHWKYQLERVLRGKTIDEDLHDFLQQESVSR